MLEVGTTVITPRFGTVKIKKIFDSLEEMTAEGYTNDSHYDENGWAIRNYGREPAGLPVG